MPKDALASLPKLTYDPFTHPDKVESGILDWSLVALDKGKRQPGSRP
jgi:hypothetical protein